MAQVKLSDLEALPYVDASNVNGRWLSTLMFYVEGEWSFWVPTNEGLRKIKGWPAESFYFGDKPEKETDIYLHFLDFLAQRACFKSVVKPLQGLDDDFFNLSASVAKIDFFYEKRDEAKNGLSRMVATEIEYLFSVCRSIFDLLQEVISKIWKTVRLHDPDIKKRSIPEAFSKMVSPLVKGESHLSLVNKYGLARELAEFYTRHVDFFVSLKAFRDNVVHRGSSIELIFSTERGFAVRENQAPFADYGVWNEEHKLNNGLCSLRPAIGHVINGTLYACEDFSSVIQSIIEFPPPIAPDLKLFMRGHFNQNLIATIHSTPESKWWDA